MAASSETVRVIGTTAALSITVGSMLGIGIFLFPPQVAGHLPTPGAFFGVWVFGAVVALAGAVACGELGAMLPQSGGDYVFQSEAFGPSVAFAAGAVLYGAIFAGSIATLSFALAQFQISGLLGVSLADAVFLDVGLRITWAQVVACGLVGAFTAINLAGARLAAWAQTVLTTLPFVAVGLLALWGIAAGVHPIAPSPTAQGGGGLSDWVAAYLAVSFAYSGWINIIYVAGEVERPGRAVPLALIGGTLLVGTVYLLLCLAFLRVLGMEGLAVAGESGSAMAGVLGGDGLRAVLTLLIAFAILASLNSTVLGGGRIAWAMARDGAAPRVFASLHPERAVPTAALALQGGWACVLILTGTFEQLVAMVSLAMLVTGAFTVGSVFILRRRHPELARPYRATGHPWLPALYIVVSVGVLGVSFMQALSGEPGAWYPLIGLGLLVAAWAGHRLFVSS